MPRKHPSTLVPVGDTDAFTPSPQRPVRVRARSMVVDAHLQPHRHAWSQLAYCATGLVQVTAASGADAESDAPSCFSGCRMAFT